MLVGKQLLKIKNLDKQIEFIRYLHFFLPLPVHDLGAADVLGLINTVMATGVTMANLPKVFKKSRRVCSVLSNLSVEALPLLT